MARTFPFVVMMLCGAAGLMGCGDGTGPAPPELIAFTSNRQGAQHDIFVMNPDGSGAMNLTNNPNADFGPAWSPDGARLAFSSARDGNDEIYRMNADGSG
ncbi:MAG: TolB family protein, partial [Gemmatimonadales bacterium]